VNNDKQDIYREGHLNGALESIDKTLREIEHILDGTSLDKAGKYRQELRLKIEKSLTKLGIKWYKKGFNKGHKEVYIQYIKTGKISENISIDVSRNLLPKSKSKIALKSSLKKEFISKYTK